MYYERLLKLCKEMMTDEGFEALQATDSSLISVWDRLASSTENYHTHKALDGRLYVPTIAEHTYEILHLAARIWRMHAIDVKTREADLVTFAIFFHDAVKYGINPFSSKSGNPLKYTAPNHSYQAAEMLKRAPMTETLFLGKTMYWPGHGVRLDMHNSLITAVAYHNGIWEKWKGVTQENKHSAMKQPLTQFICYLDMASANNGIKTDLN